MNSYGKFNEFEIRDKTYLGDNLPADADVTYDIVKWDANNRHCFTIGTLVWNPKEKSFDFSGCGMRYQEHSTEALNGWLLKWAELKIYEHSTQEKYAK